VITTNVQVLTYPVHNGIYSVIRIEDEGDGFDYEKMVDPTQEAHLEDAMGRGILMTREIFTDGLVYPTDGSVALMWKKVGETGVGKSKTETPKRTLSP
jgi:hypothetical protein